MTRKAKGIINWIIRGKDGRVHLAQFPNVPIIGWFAAMLVSNFLASGAPKVGFANLSSAFLAIWCYLEITQGLSRFRQVLGVIVAATMVYHFFQ